MGVLRLFSSICKTMASFREICLEQEVASLKTQLTEKQENYRNDLNRMVELRVNRELEDANSQIRRANSISEEQIKDIQMVQDETVKRYQKLKSNFETYRYNVEMETTELHAKNRDLRYQLKKEKDKNTKLERQWNEIVKDKDSELLKCRNRDLERQLTEKNAENKKLRGALCRMISSGVPKKVVEKKDVATDYFASPTSSDSCTQPTTKRVFPDSLDQQRLQLIFQLENKTDWISKFFDDNFKLLMKLKKSLEELELSHKETVYKLEERVRLKTEENWKYQADWKNTQDEYEAHIMELYSRLKEQIEERV